MPAGIALTALGLPATDIDLVLLLGVRAAVISLVLVLVLVALAQGRVQAIEVRGSSGADNSRHVAQSFCTRY